VKGKVLTAEEVFSRDNVVLTNQVNMTKEKQRLFKSDKEKLSSKEIRLKNNIKSRRKVPPSLIYEIVSFAQQNPKVSVKSVLDTFQNKHPNLTLAMTKNYCAGKIILFDDEFPIGNATFEEYQVVKDELVTRKTEVK
jgi:predicted RNA methylase